MLFKNFFKNFALGCYTFFFHLFSGLRNADKVAFSPSDNSLNDVGGNIEITNEEDSLYNQLLRGEVTQEVIELRHEMYYAERESHKYGSNGEAYKKNLLYEYEGEYENSDGLKLSLIQENYQDDGSLHDRVENIGSSLPVRRTIFIERKFIPKFRIEDYVEKVIVKRNDEGKAVLDLYVSKYDSQFNNIQKLFLNKIRAIYGGEIDRTLLDFDKLYFNTFKAFGSEDLHKYEFTNLSFEDIVLYKGWYVLKFISDISIDGEDVIGQYFDKETQEKFDKHEPRKNPTFNYTAHLKSVDIDEE